MTSTPPAVPAQTNQKVEKPSLTGAKIKQRKGVAKSQAKFEPEVFRDALYKYLEGVSSSTDWDGYASALDKAGNVLEYRKYADSLFEILIAGGLLAPGGSYLDDAAMSPFSIFTAKSSQLADVKPYVTVLDKVIRRYKFLQKELEESTLRGILQYINRYEDDQREKLGVATALMIQQNLVSASVLTVLQKDHLTKDDLALNFIDLVFKSYLVDQGMDHLGSALRKGGIKEPLLFFPPQKRSTPGLVVSHFRGAGLIPVADYFQKRANKEARDATTAQLRDMRDELFAPPPEAPAEGQQPTAAASRGNEDEIVEFLKEQREQTGLSPEEFTPIVWDGLVKNWDWSNRADQVEGQAIKVVKRIAPILERFTTGPKAEIALINTIQLHCFEEQVLLKAFASFLKVLYNADVISDAAIIFWAQKGAKPQGKDIFLKMTAPLVKFLQEQSDDEE